MGAAIQQNKIWFSPRWSQKFQNKIKEQRHSSKVFAANERTVVLQPLEVKTYLSSLEDLLLPLSLESESALRSYK